MAVPSNRFVDPSSFLSTYSAPHAAMSNSCLNPFVYAIYTVRVLPRLPGLRDDVKEREHMQREMTLSFSPFSLSLHSIHMHSGYSRFTQLN